MKLARSRLFAQYDNCWNIGIIHEPISSLLRPRPNLKIEWFHPVEHGKFLADPFPIKHANNLYIMCEQFDRRAHKGRIVFFELKEHMATARPEVAIELPFHLSYPYVFTHDGDRYCLLQSKTTNEIMLFKAGDFPRKWGKVATLVRDFSGADASIFQFDGQWWLTSSAEGNYSAEKLFIWRASSPLGPWTPHASNPVKTNIASSRPAGTPFVYNGNLYRPSQDCSKIYGARIIINRIIRLTSTEFEEEQAAIIEPDSRGDYPEGAHTIADASEITLIDGKRMCYRNASIDRLARFGSRLKSYLVHTT